MEHTTGTITGCPTVRMHYSLFDTQITARYGVVVDCWPLRTFCAPSALKTLNEVEVLFNAWQTGATKFRVLSNEEWEKWEAETLRVKLAMLHDEAVDDDEGGDPAGTPTATTLTNETNVPSTTPGDAPLLPATFDAPALPPTPTTATVTTGTKRPAGEGAGGASKRKKTQDTGINVGTTVDGEPLTVAKKPRKIRKDKGVKRTKKSLQATAQSDEHTAAAAPSPSTSSTMPVASSSTSSGVSSLASPPLTPTAMHPPLAPPPAAPLLTPPAVSPLSTLAAVPSPSTLTISASPLSAAGVGPPLVVPSTVPITAIDPRLLSVSESMTTV